MLNKFGCVFLLQFAVSIYHAAPAFADRDTLAQVSTIDALLNKAYDGETEIGSLKQHGDFGLGTFNQLDGEMLMLDGVIYQVRGDGSVHTPPDTIKTPFAAVTFFDADVTLDLPAGLDFDGFAKFIDKRLATKNIFYAIKITGLFKVLKARSVPAQGKPYASLKAILHKQSLFNLSNVRGTIVGIYSPAFAKGFNIPGYHLHFISDDRKVGGHVLSFELIEGRAALDDTNAFAVVLPKAAP